MIATLHGVFLAYLALALAWNALACAPAPGAGRSWERFTLLPLQGLLTAVLVADRVAPGGPPLLLSGAVAPLFPLAFALALAQNLHALARRGPRLTDIPVVLANAGLLLCTALGAASAAGEQLAPRTAALLHDHSILQHLLGSPLAHLSTLSWHVPLLVRRGEPRGVAGVLAGLFVTALAGFIAALLAIMLDTAGEIAWRFELEPHASAPRAGLHAGVLDGTQPARAAALPAPPGGWDARVLPIDAATPLPRRDGRPLLLELRAPDAWTWRVPPRAEVEQAFLEHAARLAAAERPAVLLPFPEPDGAATLVFGGLPPQDWRALYDRAAQRVKAVSPGTALGVRLHGTGERSRALLLALAAAPAPVAIAGPRLQPGNAAASGPAAADAALDAWEAWLAGMHEPPELWVLAAGLSPLAYGERAQAQFAEGCLQRASLRPAVRAIFFEGWTDAGHTLGWLRGDGTPRAVAVRLAPLLAAR